MNTSGDFSTSMETDLASSQIISKKLVTFRDIEELQENNQKLLSIVRTLSSRQEEIERASDEINSGEMKEKLDRYLEQLADMQAAMDRQAKMVDGLVRQRDMYKNMYQQQCTKQTAKEPLVATEGEENNTNADEEPPEEKKTVARSQESKDAERKLEKKVTELEVKLKQVTDEYETYKKEKGAHERMVGEEVERLRKEAESNSARCCRLKAQLDTANERFGLLQANVGSYKSQIKTLEEKCNNYNTTIGKLSLLNVQVIMGRTLYAFAIDYGIINPEMLNYRRCIGTLYRSNVIPKTRNFLIEKLILCLEVMSYQKYITSSMT